MHPVMPYSDVRTDTAVQTKYVYTLYSSIGLCYKNLPNLTLWAGSERVLHQNLLLIAVQIAMFG